MLPELRLQGAYLQVHLTLIPRLVHLFGRELLDSDCTVWIVLNAKYCGTFRRHRRWSDRGYIPSWGRLFINDRWVVINEWSELKLVLLAIIGEHGRLWCGNELLRRIVLLVLQLIVAYLQLRNTEFLGLIKSWLTLTRRLLQTNVIDLSLVLHFEISGWNEAFLFWGVLDQFAKTFKRSTS